MFGAFYGSLFKALELEAALPPPAVRFERMCHAYAVRTLQFSDNHPVKRAYLDQGQSQAQDLDVITEGLEVITHLRPNTQLLRLALRIKELVKGEWNIEETKAEWSAPWTTFPAEFIIPQCSKNE